MIYPLHTTCTTLRVPCRSRKFTPFQQEQIPTQFVNNLTDGLSRKTAGPMDIKLASDVITVRGAFCAAGDCEVRREYGAEALSVRRRTEEGEDGQVGQALVGCGVLLCSAVTELLYRKDGMSKIQLRPEHRSRMNAKRKERSYTSTPNPRHSRGNHQGAFIEEEFFPGVCTFLVCVPKEKPYPSAHSWAESVFSRPHQRLVKDSRLPSTTARGRIPANASLTEETM
ncbi:uncharacterized protein ARMOST_15179 [Armillaria ostoyae]|uniref:Uncharacterized protein n=1 Tax=Armillaria ostoyae TaxID=47428 RepID=A0A284RSQ8_ARMOS|nr:uncharacterized protein ARMOST_15179 [Armillaria ostoyae]